MNLRPLNTGAINTALTVTLVGLEGVLDASAAVTGDLVPLTSLGSSFSANATLEGAGYRLISFGSTPSAAATWTATLYARSGLSATANAVAFLNGNLNYTAALAAEPTATASGAGSYISPRTLLAGEATATAFGVGDMTKSSLFATADATAELTGTIDPRRWFQAAAAAAATFDPVDVLINRNGASSFSGVATLSGELSANSQISMSGTMDASASLATDGTDWVLAVMAGTSSGSATFQADMTRIRQFAPSTAAAAMEASGEVERTAYFAAAVDATVQLVGEVSKLRVLAAAPAPYANGFGTLQRLAMLTPQGMAANAILASSQYWYVGLSGGVACTGTVSLALKVTRGLGGSLQAGATVSGQIFPNPGDQPPPSRTVYGVFESFEVVGVYEGNTITVST